MPEPIRPEPRALLIAAEYSRRWGLGSLERAHGAYLRAAERHDIARADLYHAVWSALRYRSMLTNGRLE